MKEMLAFIGFCSLFGVFIGLAALFIEFIKDIIRDWKRNYRIKHRFDKPPTSKCYCIDCKWWNGETGRCYRFHEDSNRLTADCWFCYAAEPRKSDIL